MSAADKALVAADANGVTEYDPASGSITSVPASGLPQFAVPIGAEPDGTLLVADSSQEIVWEVKDGTAKQFAKIPATGPSRHCPVSGDGQNCTRSEFDHVVVDGKGVVYVLEKYSVPADVNTTEANHYAPLSTMLTIPSANATPTPVTLPNSISGIQGDPGALRTLAVTAADDGVYALVETPGGDFTAARYVLHIHGGSADVVGAQQRLPGDGTAQCSFKGTVSPTALPCLPDDNTASLAYLDGRLLVAGWLDAPNNSPTARTANVVIGVRG